MKKWQILMVCLIAIIGLALAGCASTSTQTTITPKVTPTDLGTNKSEVKTPPPSTQAPAEPAKVETQPSVNTAKPAPSTPQVRVESISAQGTRYDSQFAYNRLEINITSDATIDASNWKLYVGNTFYNSTNTFNASKNCSATSTVMANRNKYFYMTTGKVDTTICVSPLRDLHPQDSVNIKLYQGTELLVEKTIQIPAGAGVPYLRLI